MAKVLTLHGLRHTVAHVLAENGASEEDIAAVLGQKSSKTARLYTLEADRSRRAKSVVKKFSGYWVKERTKTVYIGGKFVYI